MADAPKKKTLRWITLYTVSGVVDIVQIIIDFTGIGVAVSEALEIAMPFVLIGLLGLFRIFSVKRVLSVAVTDAGDALTGGFAPFWIFDVWYIHRDVRITEAMQRAAEEGDAMLQPMAPLNQDGVRAPATTTGTGNTQSDPAVRNINMAPLNYNGTRRAVTQTGNTPGFTISTGTSTGTNPPAQPVMRSVEDKMPSSVS